MPDIIIEYLRRAGPVTLIIFFLSLGGWYLVMHVALLLSEKGEKELRAIDVNTSLGLLNTLAGIAPLLGLLGTVAGMIRTFSVISLFGGGNPALLAEGISEALLTTQAGLVTAFPLMLCSSLLRRKFNAPSAPLSLEKYSGADTHV